MIYAAIYAFSMIGAFWVGGLWETRKWLHLQRDLQRFLDRVEKIRENDADLSDCDRHRLRDHHGLNV